MNNTKNKPKKNKRRCNYEKTTHTLDVCHEKQLDKFSKEYNNLGKLEKELKSIEKKLKKIDIRIICENCFIIFIILIFYDSKLIRL